MKTTLFYAIEGAAIDRSAGVIRGVSVITEGEAKGHGIRIDRKTLETFKACADKFSGGVRVKADHGTGFASIVGVLENFRFSDIKLLADLRLLQSDSQYRRTMDMAETMPSAFGLSPSFSKSVEEINGESYARCEDLFSVDLVDSPAANPSGLFSAVDSKSINRMPEISEFISGLFGKNGTVTELQHANAELKTELAASRKESADLKSKFDQGQTDLATAQASIASLTTERDGFKAIIDKPDGEIEKRAALRAKQITASLGQPALEVTPGNPAAADILAQYNAITDSVERTEFYRKNKAAYDAAWKAAPHQPPIKPS